MPDLLAIRQFVQDNLDYAPANTSWRVTVDSFINDVYYRIFTGKPYDFAQKITKIPVYKDQTFTCTWLGSLTAGVTIPVSQTWPTWCEGQVLTINDVDYEIAYRLNDQTVYLTTSGEAVAGISGTLKNRYIDLPAHASQILNVSRRTNAITARNVGQYTAVSRFEDEYHNLPLDEVSVPVYWVPADDINVISPRNIQAAAVTSGSGHGVRTVEIALAFAQRGASEDYRFSSLSAAVTLSLSDTQQVRVTHTTDLKSLGLYKAVFFRSPTNGLYQWRRLSVVAPDSTAVETFTLPLSLLTEGNSLVDTNSYPLFNESDGMTQRIRLYPRQDEDYDITVRYVYRPQKLLEDQDTPDLPPAQHMMLAYAALEQLSMMTDNDSRVGYYHQKKMQGVEELDARYLTSPARRFVKQYMGQGLTQPIPLYTNLRRLP